MFAIGGAFPPRSAEVTADAPAHVEGQDMKADLEARLSRQEGTKSEPPTPKVESAVVVQPGGTEAGKESVTTDPAPPVSPPPAPEPEVGPDLSFIAQEHRPFFEKAPLATQKWMADWQRDYTKKTTAAADERRAVEKDRQTLEARKSAAEFGEAVMSDAEALDTLRALADKRKGATPAAKAPEFDPLTATPEEWKAHDADLIQRAKAEARSEQEAEARQKASATSAEEAQKAEIGAAAGKAFVDSGYELKEWDAVGEPIFVRLGGWPGLKALATAKGVDFSKDFVVETLHDFIPKKVKPQDSPHANGKAPGNGTVGASALTRGVGVAPALNLPDFIREGRQLTNQSPRGDRIAEALFDVNKARIAKGLPPLSL